MRSNLLVTTMLLFFALPAFARSERVARQYPILPPKPATNPWIFDTSKYSSLPPEFHRPRPKQPQRSKACEQDVLVCVWEEINATPSEEFRQLTKDGDAPGTLGRALPYATYLQRFVDVGLRAPRNYCAQGVRMILEAARMIPKVTDYPGHAREYYEFLSRFEFIHDWSVCRRPGAIRIYGGAKYPDRVTARMRTDGDKSGHIEIVTLEGRYMSFTPGANPVGERTGEWRRPLIACMKKKNGAKLYPVRPRGPL